MSRTAKIEIFEDPGHGWARVLKTRVAKLGIADKISTYSYQRGKYVFLEEDRDLGVLCDALRARGVTEFKFTTHHTDRQSKIRNYEYYKATQ